MCLPPSITDKNERKQNKKKNSEGEKRTIASFFSSTLDRSAKQPEEKKTLIRIIPIEM